MKNMQNEKFKTKEREYRQYLPANTLACIRLDGKAFGTFTKSFERPFDLNFMNAMDEAAKTVLKKIINSDAFAYVQSDEISIFITTPFSKDKEIPFNGRIEKLLSTSASAATGGFMKTLETDAIPLFDSRVFTFENLSELEEYLDWRRLDARKNSISMAAETKFSSADLYKKNTKERWEMLQDTEHKTLPNDFMWGRLITKENFEEEIEYFNKKKLQVENTTAVRSRWIKESATREAAQKLIKTLESK